MADTVRILGFAGSLRRESYNRAMLRLAVEVAPAEMRLETFELDGIPPFSQDEEAKPPPKVRQFKELIRAADGLLIAVPEYNYSMSGVLKNAIDWASRPYGDSAFDNKPLAIMGASVGMTGTARAQYHLRQTCVFLNMHVLNQPEIMVPFVTDKVDAQGKVTDAKTREKVAEMLQALAAWVQRLAAAPAHAR